MKPLRYTFLPLALLGIIQIGIASPVRAELPKPDAYRKHALTHEGNPTHGKVLFNDETRTLCSKCHSIDGSASKAGPDLFAAGDAFGRRDLIESVLSPSATISPGYGTVIVETRKGETYQGTLKQSNDEGIQLMGIDGKLVSIKSSDIKEKSGSPASLMPEGLFASLTVQEFTDLIEYLTTLRQPASSAASEHGMPSAIESLGKPIGTAPYLASTFKLPRARAETGLASFRQVPGQPDVFLVLHQKGMIWKVAKHASEEQVTVFSDLTSEVFSERGPNGLQDVAFHPGFRQNHKYYLFYQVFENATVATHIIEKEFAADFSGDSGKPGRLIIKFESVAEDHSGGCLAFGPDGYLYLVMGDTGPHNDPNGHAQNLQLLLGKLLRIDVNQNDGGLAYSIPADNPFTGTRDVRPEIWAYGLRNPWRFSFDRVTGDLWLADVGQDRVEEVDIVHRGDNLGWNVYEGFEAFSNQYKKPDRTYSKPVFAYRRKYGNSITGGFVYRGDTQSTFYGVYIFGDYNSKRIFGMTQENGALKMVRQIGTIPQRLASFAEDESGRIFAIGYEGTIYELDLAQSRFE